MSASLTTLISRVQAQLIDDGTRFSTATVTAAIRAALSKLNGRIPIYAGTYIEVIADQKEYELTAEDDRAITVIDVLKRDADGEDHEPLLYDPYNEDERVFFRLRTAQQSGDILCRYVIPHTINGLDSETESTLSADLDQVLTDGACVEAIIIRGLSRVETINLQKDVSDNYREAVGHFRNAFELGLQRYERNRRPPVSEIRTDAWNDAYHGWDV